MTPRKSSPFLAAAMRTVRSGRLPLAETQPFFTRVEHVPAGNYVEIWFRTAGCTWDHAGGCTMCNYGHGEDINAPDLTRTIASALADLCDQPHELMISPSGGMWDPVEVPAEALPKIYAQARARSPDKFFVETRAETVTPERINSFRAAFPDTALAVEIGLESSHDAVLAYCVNKGSTSRTFIRAAGMLKKAGVETYANVSLGTALLDRATAVRDAIASVRWALANGASRAVVFPLHVKPYTLLDILQTSGAYTPVSLWDLVEVLDVLGAPAAGRVEIAWYKSYYDTDAKVTASPQGCGQCHERLMRGLDEYRATQNHEVIVGLERTRCACAPPHALSCPLPGDDEQLASNILAQYDAIASTLSLEDKWRELAPRLEPELRQAFSGFLATRSQAAERVA
jgi:radical SAM enzyme (TIGR01210 family)